MTTFDPDHRIDLEINEHNLTEHMCSLPGDVAFYAEKVARLAAVLKEKQDEIRLVEADMDETVRVKLEQSGQKLTETAIRRLIQQTEQHRSLSAAIVEVEGQHLKAKAALKTLDTKRDMLISLGTFIRQEMQSGISIRTPRSVFTPGPYRPGLPEDPLQGDEGW